MRGYQRLAIEAELMSSSPERVFDWLARQGAEPAEFQTDLDKECELALLDRQEPLIDLALARFCRNDATAKALFAKTSLVSPETSHQQAVRLAILSNESMRGLWSFTGLPGCLFDSSDGGLLTWLGQAPDDEISALFGNPNIDELFLRDFLEGGEQWKAMDEQRQMQSIQALSYNPRMQTGYSGDLDGWAEYTYNSVFYAAWKLTKTLPATRHWALALGSLLRKLCLKSHEMDDALAVAMRWRPASDDESGQEDETKYAKRGHLEGYALVRQRLATLKADGDPNIQAGLLTNGDHAFRACIYESFPISPAQIAAAFVQDKNLALNCCQGNLSIWRTPECRSALHDISWEACTFNDNYLDAANDFNRKEKELRSEYPNWFKEEDGESDESTQPATKGDVDALVETVVNHSNSIHEGLVQTGNALDKVFARIGWIWWFSLGALVASVWHLL